MKSKTPVKEKQFTFKQERFIHEYIANNGNATDAARKAGYKGNENTLNQISHKLVTNGKIKSRIDQLKAELLKPVQQKIKDKAALQVFWSDLIDSKEIATTDKLRSSELLGKSHGAFVDNINSTTEQPTALSIDEIAELKAIAARATGIKLKQA